MSPKRWLIVVDWQNDFDHNGSLAVTNGAKSWNNIKPLLDLPFDVIIATQDWHPIKHVSFASTHKKPPFSLVFLYYPNVKPKNKSNIIDKYPQVFDTKEKADQAKKDNKNKGVIVEQVLWPDHCIQTTPGAEFVKEWKETIPKCNALVIKKGENKFVDSYSGLWSNGHLESTDLQKLMLEEEPDEVVICGVALDYCVGYTALDTACSLPNSRVIVITDATRYVAPTYKEAIKLLEGDKVFKLTTKEYIKSLDI